MSQDGIYQLEKEQEDLKFNSSILCFFFEILTIYKINNQESGDQKGKNGFFT